MLNIQQSTQAFILPHDIPSSNNVSVINMSRAKFMSINTSLWLVDCNSATCCEKCVLPSTSWRGVISNTRCNRKPKVSHFTYRCRTNAGLRATRLFPPESGCAERGNREWPYVIANCVIAFAWLLFLQRCVFIVFIWRHSFIFITMCA